MEIAGNLVLLFCAFITVTQLQTAEALQCYECVDCNDGFDPNAGSVLEVPCAGSCMKAKLNGMVSRGCSILKMEEKCAEEERGGQSAALCHCSSKDLCNGSAHVQVTMTTALVVLAAIFRNYL